MSEKLSSATSYGGGAISVLSALTLTHWGILVGMATALATFLLNVHFQRRKDRREQELHDLKVLHLKTSTGSVSAGSVCEAEQ